MKTQFTIFYSWQSDIRENRNRINDCIEKAIKLFKKQQPQEINLEINLDRDTVNQSGSPEISNLIFNKILQSDIFICDITLINNSWFNRRIKARLTPNPNVIMELGFAVNNIGWERIICVNNLKHGSLEQLPFDIRGHRIATYNSEDKGYKDKLTQTMLAAITSIIGDYSKIEKRHNVQKHKIHDKDIFEKIAKICSETELHDSLSSAVNSLFSNDYYYKKWDGVIEFYKESMNFFLDTDVDITFRAFLSKLDEFRMLCYQKFFSDEASRKKPKLQDYVDAGMEITDELQFEIQQSYVYRPHKEPFESETYPEADDRIHKLQDELYELAREVMTAYQQFVLTTKKNILVHTK